MKTLIIHPPDVTTAFLSPLYGGIECTVIDFTSSAKIRRAIIEHERIIMLGHGTPWGLLNGSKKGYTVDSRMVQFLRPKLCIGVWCFASEFFRKYGLKGFSTGMIISEPAEAEHLEVPYAQGDIETSNAMLTEALTQLVTTGVLGAYKGLNAVMEFNKNNLV